MILVTGCTGFIGTHLLSKLIAKYGGDNILALTSKPVDECNYLLHNGYSFDRNFFVENGYSDISTIMHLGAFIPKNSSEANNIEQCNSNITNTYNLLNCFLPKLKKVIFYSTVDIYKNTDYIDENTQESPVSLYGESKLYCEKMLQNWTKQNNKNLQILRIGHVYGPREEAYLKIIPETFKKIINKESVKIWGTGEDLRSFIYIDDVVEATINAIDLDEEVGVINVVGNQAISIKDLVSKIIDITGHNHTIEYVSTDVKPRNLSFDNSKLAKYLLKKETDLDVGLTNEYNYFLNLSN